MSVRVLPRVRVGGRGLTLPDCPLRAHWSGRSPSLRVLCFHNAGSAESVFTGPTVVNRKRVPNGLASWCAPPPGSLLRPVSPIAKTGSRGGGSAQKLVCM